MKKMHYVFSLIMLATLSACDGGGSSGGGTSDDSSFTVPLKPLNLSISGSPITTRGVLSTEVTNYVDISKVGSHPNFKLILTNPNTVAVTRPTEFNSDYGWIMYQASPDKQTEPTEKELNDYYTENNPSFNISLFTKTDNVDDCFKTNIIPAGKSCTFYLTDNWVPSTSTKDTFSYPLSYTIRQVDNPSNYLKVQQCSFTRYAVPAFSCANQSKPGYDKQFITYKIIPIIGKTIPESARGTMALSGKRAYIDDYNDPDILKVSISTVNYQNNVINYSSPQFKYSFFNGQAQDGVISYSGDLQWAQVLNSQYDYRIYNSDGKIYEIPNWWEIDIVTVSVQQLLIAGLDNSIWVNMPSPDKDLSPVVYDAKQDQFVESNIKGSIWGIDTNHLVITINKRQPAQFSCWGSTGNYKYVQQQLRNYIGNLPTSEGSASSLTFSELQIYNNVYIPMYVPNLVNIKGEPYTHIVGWYKVHTKDTSGNDACYIDVDDYMSDISSIITPQFALFNGYRGTISIENVYLGK